MKLDHLVHYVRETVIELPFINFYQLYFCDPQLYLPKLLQ